MGFLATGAPVGSLGVRELRPLQELFVSSVQKEHVSVLAATLDHFPTHFVRKRSRGSRIEKIRRHVNNSAMPPWCALGWLRVCVADDNHLSIYLSQFSQTPSDELALRVARETFVKPKPIQLEDIGSTVRTADSLADCSRTRLANRQHSHELLVNDDSPRPRDGARPMIKMFLYDGEPRQSFVDPREKTLLSLQKHLQNRA